MHHWGAVELTYGVSGLAVGMLIGLTGVGGGSLMTPLLILVFGVHPTSAVGTDLIYAALTKGIGSAIHHANRTVVWRIVRRLAIGSISGTILTILALRLFGATGPVATALTSVTLGIALLLSSAMLLLKKPILRAATRRNPDPGRVEPVLPTIAVGFVVGVLVSISSVGAGALGTTALLFLCPGLQLAKIVGTDIAHAVFLTLVAGLAHAWLGTIDLHILVSLLAGSIPGVIAGSLAVRFVPEAVLRPVLALVLAAVGVRMLA